MQEGPYNKRDFYVAGLTFSVEDWVPLPTVTQLQMGADGGGGFNVPVDLRQFFVTVQTHMVWW